MARHNCLKNKTLIIGVIILFILAIVTSSISGYDKKTNIQSVVQTPICSPLTDDYVNSYWMFDECSGDIVGDSSGHNYNGTRHGATWVGYGSDCELLFDGVDDYVNFSAHSAEIFFNKTDDFIISFYFRSTGEGIIYSGTAPWGFNPDFQIELVSNGSLLFKLIGSSNLGITLYSNNKYNDGDHHFVEYYHNGISTSPTVTLFVDNVSENSMTSYYYNIENDEYTKAKMGMNAHSSTGYFDGYIDNFKIIKYEQGNEQEPPTINGSGGPPGVELDFIFVTNDPEENDVWILIDWGDGTEEDWRGPYKSGEEVTISHKWDEEGIYDLRAKSKDIWGESPWDGFEIKIGYYVPEPKICCSGSINLPDVKPKSTLTGNFEVTNCGEVESSLNWIVAEYPNWGSGWTSTPESGSGLTPEEPPITVNVEFVAPPDKGSEFSGVIKVENIEDPSDFCEIPISITTPRNRITFNPLIFWFLEQFQMLERLLNLIKVF